MGGEKEEITKIAGKGKKSKGKKEKQKERKAQSTESCDSHILSHINMNIWVYMTERTLLGSYDRADSIGIK